jgi:hypothetical protein
MTPGERERADAMDVRCLDLCIGMLERVNGVSNLCLLFILCQLTNLGLSNRRSKKTRLWRVSSAS